MALNLSAHNEPPLWPASLLGVCSLASLYTQRALIRGIFIAIAAVAFGFVAMGLRTAWVKTPMLDHPRIITMTSLVQEVDIRDYGARFVLRELHDEHWQQDINPYRVRVTSKYLPDVNAGDRIRLKARLLPPAHAVLPEGYDFAHEAYFQSMGAVGSVLGQIQKLPSGSLTLSDRLDRFRNALAMRIEQTVGGDEGAIAVAMVTGKRDLLSSDAKDLIRRAGIFHIITISGIQMTLVSGIIFSFTRRVLALSTTLVIHWPIKKISALVAMLGAVAYDLVTGSRVGTMRALAMTLILLWAVVFDRRALTMRNLAFAIFAVLILEPEAVMGVSFQLSFAAVAALIAVMEARANSPDQTASSSEAPLPRMLQKVGRLLLATLCATSATAPFIAYNFHEMNLYVLIGNPLTLAMIECVAVPGALLGTALYPLGLDMPIWLFVGLGVKCVLFVARWIAIAPWASLHLPAFAPWSLPCFALAVASMVIWRSWGMRASSIVFFTAGLVGGVCGPHYDILIPPSGDELAFRDSHRRLWFAGRHHNAFTEAQWLAADGDERDPLQALAATCDRQSCAIDATWQGQKHPISLVLQYDAFKDICPHAFLVVTPLTAPSDCQPPLLFDERKLAQTGAVGITFTTTSPRITTNRDADLDRPWYPAPFKPWRPVSH